LLKCVNRILCADKGRIELFGRNINEHSQKDLGRMIGYVPQTQEYAFSYTVREFVTMGRYSYLSAFSGISGHDRTIVDEAIELTGLNAFRERTIHQLRGGEKQKVYIAACLAQQPKILLLDEPTNHLDPKHQFDVQRTIADISSKFNCTIVQVTHDLSHIAHWSQKIIAMNEGRIVFNGPPDDVITSPNLRKLYNAEFHLIPDPDSKQTMIISSCKRQ